MIRLLHAADLHLDSPFDALGEEKAALRRREQRGLLRSLAAIRAEQGAQLVLLSGDLFDSDSSWAETEELLILTLSEMPIQALAHYCCKKKTITTLSCIGFPVYCLFS